MQDQFSQTSIRGFGKPLTRALGVGFALKNPQIAGILRYIHPRGLYIVMGKKLDLHRVVRINIFQCLVCHTGNV
jgi:hypothetical protein